MSLPSALSDSTLAKILARVPVSLEEDRALTSPMSPTPVGRIRIWRGDGPVVKVVNVSLVVPMISLDSHMIFAFTAPDSGVPHFTLDSVANGDSYAFHLDLIPRIDLATSLSYLDEVYEPLTGIFTETKGRDGLTPAHLTPRQYALMSPWMLVNRATEAAFRSIDDAVEKYVTKDYVAATCAEWARANFEGVQIDPEDLRGIRRVEELEDFIKGQAKNEADSNISATLGEFMAWLTGWNLILEYGVACVAVAIGWSGYFTNLLALMGLALPQWATRAPADGGLANLPAAVIVLLVTWILVLGIKKSARTTCAIESKSSATSSPRATATSKTAGSGYAI